MSAPNNNNKNNSGGGDNNNRRSTIGFLSIIMWAVIFVLLIQQCTSTVKNSSAVEVPYSTLRVWVVQDYVEEVDMKSNSFTFTLRPGALEQEDVKKEIEEILNLTEEQKGLLESVLNTEASAAVQDASGETVFVTAPLNDGELISLMHEHGVRFGAKLVSESSQMLYALASYVLPVLVMVVAMIFIYQFIFKKMGSMGGMGGGVGKANAKVYVEKQTGVTFRDVAGQDEAKESLQEIIDILHNPGKYTEIGAKLPKGALLVGPPGTGKTLLAKAVAGEANVPFFSISGSDFVELYVGVGASRVRDLFKEAAKLAPCIIFIDEIDTIGKSRNDRYGGGSEEREQTLNQLLAELDGFDPTKGVIVLGATNRPEVLDKALLRPGRFDRRITIDRPNLAGRLATLQVHTRNIRLAEDVDLNKIALATAGTVGADLANLVNEAALRAVRHGRRAVNQEDLLASFEFVIAGSEKKNSVLTEFERRLVAYHEVGHAMVAYKQKDGKPVQKITIVPHTQGALGYTLHLPEEDKNLSTKEELMAKITVSMGGRAAEEVVLNTMTNGASQDIQDATNVARNMVAMFGMSEEFGMMALGSVRNQYLDGGYGLDCAQDTAAVMDRAVKAIIDVCYKQAVEVVKDSREEMDKVVAYLLQKETITGGEMVAIIEGRDPNQVEGSYTSTRIQGDIEPPARNIHMVSEPVEAPKLPESPELPTVEDPNKPGGGTAPSGGTTPGGGTAPGGEITPEGKKK